MTRAHEAVMRVDGGDRDVILVTSANGYVGNRRLSAHGSSRISNTVYRLRGPGDVFVKELLSDSRTGPLGSALSTRVSFHARGRVSRTTAATSSIAGIRPSASLKSPYRAGDNAPAPIVPV